jgi:hypothetical protein
MQVISMFQSMSYSTPWFIRDCHRYLVNVERVTCGRFRVHQAHCYVSIVKVSSASPRTWQREKPVSCTESDNDKISPRMYGMHYAKCLIVYILTTIGTCRQFSKKSQIWNLTKIRLVWTALIHAERITETDVYDDTNHRFSLCEGAKECKVFSVEAVKA